MGCLNSVIELTQRPAVLQLNVKLMVDAEHSYFQPAIGAHFDLLLCWKLIEQDRHWQALWLAVEPGVCPCRSRGHRAAAEAQQEAGCHLQHLPVLPEGAPAALTDTRPGVWAAHCANVLHDLQTANRGSLHHARLRGLRGRTTDSMNGLLCCRTLKPAW